MSEHRALAALTITTEGGTATISPGDGAPLLSGERPDAAIVRIAPRVLSQMPSSHARVHVLRTAASIAAQVEAHAPLAIDGTHRGRLAFDVPRRIARAIGIATAEPGDRFRGGFTHVFFDDEALIVEGASAGLAFVARRGSWVVFERGPSPGEQPASFARELGRAVRIVRAAETARLRETPQRAIARMRQRGRLAVARGPIGRARLRRAIGWIDAAFWLFERPNCFRRTLAEIALDRGAAEETVVFGLDVGKTGHVAFKDAEDRTFDVAFEFPPL